MTPQSIQEAAERAWRELNSALNDGMRATSSAVEIIVRNMQPAVADGAKQLSAADLLAWLKGRPGCSWVATIHDVERAINELSKTPPAEPTYGPPPANQLYRPSTPNPP